MISKHTYNGLTWIDIKSPVQDELLHVSDEYSVPNFITTELLEPSMRSKVDLYDNFIYVVLHFPQVQKELADIEVDFLIGKNFFITVRYNDNEIIENFIAKLEGNTTHSSNKNLTHSGLLFVSLMKKHYQQLLNDLDDLAKKIKDIEYAIFKGNQERMVRAISFISRELIDFNRAVRFHKDVLESFQYVGVEFFGEEFQYHTSLLRSEFNKIHSVLESHRETLSELQRTNDSLLSTKQNSIMKKFTVISFVTAPLVLITGIFGMNVNDNIIFIQKVEDFFLIIGIMAIISLLMVIFFKLRQWL